LLSPFEGRGVLLVQVQSLYILHVCPQVVITPGAYLDTKTMVLHGAFMIPNPLNTTINPWDRLMLRYCIEMPDVAPDFRVNVV
jgi:hypothetical protein